MRQGRDGAAGRVPRRAAAAIPALTIGSAPPRRERSRNCGADHCYLRRRRSGPAAGSCGTAPGRRLLPACCPRPLARAGYAGAAAGPPWRARRNRRRRRSSMARAPGLSRRHLRTGGGRRRPCQGPCRVRLVSRKICGSIRKTAVDRRHPGAPAGRPLLLHPCLFRTCADLRNLSRKSRGKCRDPAAGFRAPEKIPLNFLLDATSLRFPPRAAAQAEGRQPAVNPFHSRQTFSAAAGSSGENSLHKLSRK